LGRIPMWEYERRAPGRYGTGRCGVWGLVDSLVLDAAA
jgi:hypothetical protein